jgi:predicted metal-dependent hydrolase
MTRLSELSSGIVPFLGNPTVFALNKHPFGYTRVFHCNNQIRISLPHTETEAQKTGASLLLNWLKSYARKEITERVIEICTDNKLSFNRIAIKDTRSRWGSCSAKNNLNFNWRLILAPHEVLRYVVVHETAHLEQMNHSQAFWAIVAKRCQNFWAHREWLKKNGHELLSWTPRFNINHPVLLNKHQAHRCPEVVQTSKYL